MKGPFRDEISHCWYYTDEYGNHHRENGPAIVYDSGSELWCVHGNFTCDEVSAWMSDCNVNSNWREWTDSEKTLFKLRFV